MIETGYADAGVMKVADNSSFAVALKADCNPRYCKIDPYWGAVNATAESMRNVVAVGAIPRINRLPELRKPEKPESFYDFYEGVRE